LSDLGLVILASRASNQFATTGRGVLPVPVGLRTPSGMAYEELLVVER